MMMMMSGNRGSGFPWQHTGVMVGIRREKGVGVTMVTVGDGGLLAYPLVSESLTSDDLQHTHICTHTHNDTHSLSGPVCVFQ